MHSQRSIWHHLGAEYFPTETPKEKETVKNWVHKEIASVEIFADFGGLTHIQWDLAKSWEVAQKRNVSSATTIESNLIGDDLILFHCFLKEKREKQKQQKQQK